MVKDIWRNKHKVATLKFGAKTLHKTPAQSRHNTLIDSRQSKLADSFLTTRAASSNTHTRTHKFPFLLQMSHSKMTGNVVTLCRSYPHLPLNFLWQTQQSSFIVDSPPNQPNSFLSTRNSFIALSLSLSLSLSFSLSHTHKFPFLAQQEDDRKCCDPLQELPSFPLTCFPLSLFMSHGAHSLLGKGP